MPPDTPVPATRESAAPEPVEWDEEVSLLVTFRLSAQSNPEFFEGLDGRTPLDLAMAAAWRGGLGRLENVDGWADFFGGVDVIDVQEGY